MKENSFAVIFQEYKNQQRYSQKHILKMMWPNAWRDGLVSITAYFTGQATVLMSGIFLTLYETGIYSFSVQVLNAICSL